MSSAVRFRPRCPIATRIPASRAVGTADVVVAVPFDVADVAVDVDVDVVVDTDVMCC